MTIHYNSEYLVQQKLLRNKDPMEIIVRSSDTLYMSIRQMVENFSNKFIHYKFGIGALF